MTNPGEGLMLLLVNYSVKVSKAKYFTRFYFYFILIHNVVFITAPYCWSCVAIIID